MEKPHKPPPPPVAPKPKPNGDIRKPSPVRPAVAPKPIPQAPLPDADGNSADQISVRSDSPVGSVTTDTNHTNTVTLSNPRSNPSAPLNDILNQPATPVTVAPLIEDDSKSELHSHTPESINVSSPISSANIEFGQPLRPPRTKKLKVIKQSIRIDDDKVTMREKSESEDKRSSKPPRGTLMLAREGLFAKLDNQQEISRPVPKPRIGSVSTVLTTDKKPSSTAALTNSSDKSVVQQNSTVKGGNTVVAIASKDEISAAPACINVNVVGEPTMNSSSGRTTPNLSTAAPNAVPIRDSKHNADGSMSSKDQTSTSKLQSPPIPKPRHSLTIPHGAELAPDQTSSQSLSQPHELPVDSADPALRDVTADAADNHLTDDDNLYGCVWAEGPSDTVEPGKLEKLYNNTGRDSPNRLGRTSSVATPASCSPKKLNRTGSAPITSTSPKMKPKRPSQPPPPIPSPLTRTTDTKSVKKLVPTRPPPPVPKNKAASVKVGTSGPAPLSVFASRISEIPSAELADSSENIYTDVEEPFYNEPDASLEISLQTDASAGVANHSTSEHAEAVSADEAGPGIMEEEYMVPVAKDHNWPEQPAPSVPGATSASSATSSAEGSESKSMTLLSYTSNVYEDLCSSSEDDQSSYSCDNRTDDVYSDFLDETFDNEDNPKAGSTCSSESEAEPEPEESEEEKMAKQRIKAFKVAQEIMSSEEEFCDKLVLLNIDFRKHISEAIEHSGEPVIPAQCMNNILNYLPQLANINDVLLKDLKQRVQNWDDDPRLADIFVKTGPFLQMYTTYIRDFQNMTSELDNAIKEYPLFAEALKIFEKSERCRNLQLRHYMLKPIQRIPQYRLLLNEYRKYLPSDSPDKDDTKTALEIVSKVADHANEAMKQNDSLQSLLELQGLLIGDFKVIEPARVLVRRGDMYKQSRKELQPRTLFLFNDHLVITSPQTGGYYKINHALPLLHMQITKPIREDFQKEFTVITKKRSFTSVAFTPRERDEWVTILGSTVAERERKMGTYNRGLMDNIGSREYVLGEVAPVWIPDDRVTMCMISSTPFTLTRRRHHCRACGKVVCGACSAFKAPLKYVEYSPKRVCKACYDKLYAEMEALDEKGVNVAKKSNLSRAVMRHLFSMKAAGNTPVKAKPQTVLQEVHANDVGEFSGYLSVQVKKKHWEKFWFVIKDKVLYKYNACEDTSAIESKPLLGYKVAQVGTSYEGFDKTVLFKLHHPAKDIIEPVIFKTETAGAADRWIERMQESTTT